MAAMSRPGTVYNTSPLPLLVNGLVVASGYDLHVADLDTVELSRPDGSYVVPDDAEPSPKASTDASVEPPADGDAPATAAADDGKPARAHRARKSVPAAEAATEETTAP